MGRCTLIVLVITCLNLAGCFERIVEQTDVFSDVHQGETYSPASRMIDDWYAVEAIDEQTFAINEPKSSQYNTSYLIIGDKSAIMFDAGSGERPAGSRSMRAVAERYADGKPITLILSHFHYDHIYDAATFDNVILIDRPEIRANLDSSRYTITTWESLSFGSVHLKEVTLVRDGEPIDLGGRKLEMINLPGHTTESVILVDRTHNHIFSGDFVYRHLGGIIAFAPGADLDSYKRNSARLLELTDAETQFFGAHGIPRFGRDWLMRLDKGLDRMLKGDSEYRYVTHYLAPGIPWRVYQNGDLYIYTTPVLDPSLFWSKWTLLTLIIVSTLPLYFLLRMRRLIHGRAGGMWM